MNLVCGLVVAFLIVRRAEAISRSVSQSGIDVRLKLIATRVGLQSQLRSVLFRLKSSVTSCGAYITSWVLESEHQIYIYKCSSELFHFCC